MDSYKQTNKSLLRERGMLYYRDKAMGFFIFIPIIILLYPVLFFVNEILHGRNVNFSLQVLFILSCAIIPVFLIAFSESFSRQRLTIYTDGFFPQRKPFFYALRHPTRAYFVKWSDVKKINYDEASSKEWHPSKFKNLKKYWSFIIWVNYRGKEKMHLITYRMFEDPDEAYKILREIFTGHADLPWVNVNDMFRFWKEEKEEK